MVALDASTMRFSLDSFGLRRSLYFGFASAICIAFLSIFIHNEYTSDARILPGDGKGSSNIGQLLNAATTLGIGIPGQETGEVNFVDILNSRFIKEEIINTKFDFMIPGRFIYGPQTRQETLYAYFKAKNMDQAVRELSGMITVGRDAKSKVIQVSAKTESPELSRQIVSKLLSGLEEFVLGKGRTRGSEKARFSLARLRETKEELVQAENALRDFLNRNRNYQISSDPTVRLLGARLEAELKLKQQLVLTLSINREQSLLEEKNDIPIVNILDRPNLPQEKSGPARSIMVLGAFVLSGLLSLLWWNRNLLYEKLITEPEGVPVEKVP